MGMKFELHDEEGQLLAKGDKELNGYPKPKAIMWLQQLYVQHPADHHIYELSNMMIVVNNELEIERGG